MDKNVTDPAAKPGSMGSKRALLIGVDGYQSVPSLQGCVNDILAIRSFLIDKAGVAAQDIRVLAQPPAGSPIPGDVGPTAPPTRQNILAAFATLGQQTQAHDQVIIYYSGHGVRIGEGGGTLLANAEAEHYHISAICPVDTQLSGLNLVLNHELNAGINRLISANATVTVVFDCCHSGGVASRDLDTPAPEAPVAREVVLDPANLDWAGMKQQYGLDSAAIADGQRDILPEGSGWVPTIAQAAELIVVSGCRDVEVSHEYTPAGQRHGALTYFLLDALQQVNPAQVAGMRWLDLYPKIRANVNGQFPDQTPTLEGRTERPVFGGQWTPYAPGFTVRTAGDGTLTLNGGAIHGLGTGAQVAIYPPGTVSFTEAVKNNLPRILANVVNATPVSSQAQVVDGTAGTVADGSRAVLLRPSTDRPPIPVGFSKLPDPILNAIKAAPGASALLNFSPGTLAPIVEVRAWTRHGQSGYAIVKAKIASVTNPVGENDVIGFLASDGVSDDAEMAGRLAQGLVQWAQYRGVVDRRNDEPRLKDMIHLRVLASTNGSGLAASAAGSDALERAPNTAGTVVVADNESLLLKIEIDSGCPTALHVAIILCSDEGNIQQVYDTGQNTLPAGEQAPVGVGGPRGTFKLPVSTWQTASAWTFKVIATDEAHPFDVRSLTLDMTVQDWLTGGAKALLQPDPLPQVLWTTVEVPVVVNLAYSRSSMSSSSNSASSSASSPSVSPSASLSNSPLSSSSS